MTPDLFKYGLAVVVFTVISAVADSYGFLHAAKIWDAGRLVLSELGRSLLGFAVGISMYWLLLRYLQQLGVVVPELQTLFWFGATMIGVALGSGAFFGWAPREQFVAIGVVAGIGWLLVKTGG